MPLFVDRAHSIQTVSPLAEVEEVRQSISFQPELRAPVTYVPSAGWGWLGDVAQTIGSSFRRFTRSAGAALLASALLTGGCALRGSDIGVIDVKPGNGAFSVSAEEVAKAREQGDHREIAKVLHEIAVDRKPARINNDDTRLARMTELLQGLTADQIDQVRAQYVDRYGCDPQTHIRSWDFFQPLARLSDALVVDMVALLNGPRLAQHVDTLRAMLDKAERGELTSADRRQYFAMMPMIGLWDAPRRNAPDGRNLDAVERKILLRLSHAKDLDLNEALRTIEAKMPPADLAPKAPVEKSIAVMVSSAGAQWQELMDWAVVMKKAGYHIQIFTAEGRPAAFQADSLSVNERTARVGHGAPQRLDPQGEAGALARELLAGTASAADFVEAHYGAKFSAGGLGFNEDIAVATDDNGRAHIALHPHVKRMNEQMAAARKPMISICHGPTELADTAMTIGGRTETVNRGIKTASLPPFEAYVGLTGRKEVQFLYDVNTHDVLKEAGGRTSQWRDIANLSRTVWATKDGLDVITGAGPQASRNLAKRTIEAMERWAQRGVASW